MNFYLMPHPPIIIPAIGKGEELKLYKTTLAVQSNCRGNIKA